MSAKPSSNAPSSAARETEGGTPEGLPPRRGWWSDLPGSFRWGALVIALFSLGINLLQLALPLYSMQVYDRVLPSGNVPTLIALSLIVAVLIIASALLEGLRAQMLARLGNALEIHWRDRLVRLAFNPFHPKQGVAGHLRDLDLVRNWIASPGMAALFDLPWSGLFVVTIFILAAPLGWVTLGAIALVIVVALLGEIMARRPLHEGQMRSAAAHMLFDAALIEREVNHALGSTGPVTRRVGEIRNRALASGTRALDRLAWAGAASRGTRSLLQIGILMAAAFLVLSDSIAAGVIVASSMMFTRALVPIDRVSSGFRQSKAALAALIRLGNLMNLEARDARQISLPPLSGRVEVQDVSGRSAARAATGLEKVSFSLQPGETLAVVGASGAGKSTLARILVGALAPSAGTVRLDGNALSDWPIEELGRQIGFLAQDVQFMEGAAAEIIARSNTPEDAKVIEAARLAGAHEMIQGLPNGYQTVIGRYGYLPSSGERQRIGLARAFYGDPALIVLDEPTANLDDKGEKQVLAALQQMRARGATIIVISRLISVLHAADHVLMLDKGRVKMAKPRSELDSYLGPRLAATRPEERPLRAAAPAGG